MHTIDLDTMKISQMIIEFASDYIHIGKTIEEKQDYLNAACIAWNIAILPKINRKKALENFLINYKQNNPECDVDVLNGIKEDMQQLIQGKNKLFPNVKLNIIKATIYETESEYRVIAAALPLEQKGILKA